MSSTSKFKKHEVLRVHNIKGYNVRWGRNITQVYKIESATIKPDVCIKLVERMMCVISSYDVKQAYSNQRKYKARKL